MTTQVVIIGHFWIHFWTSIVTILDSNYTNSYYLFLIVK